MIAQPLVERCVSNGCWDAGVFNTALKLAYARNYLAGLFIGALCLLIAYAFATKRGAGRRGVLELFFLTLGLVLSFGAVIIGSLTLYL